MNKANGYDFRLAVFAHSSEPFFRSVKMAHNSKRYSQASGLTPIGRNRKFRQLVNMRTRLGVNQPRSLPILPS